jgi:hypothetical protein
MSKAEARATGRTTCLVPASGILLTHRQGDLQVGVSGTLECKSFREGAIPTTLRNLAEVNGPCTTATKSITSAAFGTHDPPAG